MYKGFFVLCNNCTRQSVSYLPLPNMDCYQSMIINLLILQICNISEVIKYIFLKLIQIGCKRKKIEEPEEVENV